jgi:hypothetical protein
MGQTASDNCINIQRSKHQHPETRKTSRSPPARLCAGQDAGSEYGLRHITRMGTRSRQGRLAWNVAHSAAAACHIAPQSSALPLSACHVTPRKQPRIEASPLSGGSSEAKIQTSPLCGEVFYCAACGEVAFLGPLGGVDMNYLYRDVS